MTLLEKWSSLFHHVLDNPEKVTPGTAEEAFLLINWMRSRWEWSQRAEGYRPREELVQQTATVCEALKDVYSSGIVSASWPSEIFEEWEYERPFHAALEEYLHSDWESLRRLLQKIRDQGAIHNDVRADDKGPVLYIVSASPVAGNAWNRIMKVVLPSHWSVYRISAIADAYPPEVGRETRIVFGSACDVEAQRAARTQWEMLQRNEPSGPDCKVIDSTSVVEVSTRLSNLSKHVR